MTMKRFIDRYICYFYLKYKCQCLPELKEVEKDRNIQTREPNHQEILPPLVFSSLQRTIIIGDGTVAGKYSASSGTVNSVSNEKFGSSKMFRPKTFSETIRPILLLNILFGTGSFVLSKEQKVRKCMECVYTVIAWVSFNLVFMSQYFFYNASQPSNIVLNSSIITSWNVIAYQLMTVLIFVTKFKTKITQDLIETVDKIDQKMKSIGLPSQDPIQYKHHMYNVGGWLVHVMIALAITWIFRIDPSAPFVNKIGLTISCNMITITIMTVQLSFTVWVGHIGMKLSQLNDLLEEMIETTNRSAPKRFLEVHNSQVQKRRRQNVHAVKENVETIAKAKEFHLDLIKIARHINKFYGIQLLLTTLVWFLTILTLLYMFNFCIWELLPKLDMTHELFPVLIWILLSMFPMIHLHSNCVQTSNEAGKAGFLLCRLYNSSTSIKFRNEVQYFTHQVQENPLVLSICGLVDIDRTFLTGVVGSIVAYLLVIVQLAWPSMYSRRKAANATDVNATYVYATTKYI